MRPNCFARARRERMRGGRQASLRSLREGAGKHRCARFERGRASIAALASRGAGRQASLRSLREGRASIAALASRGAGKHRCARFERGRASIATLASWLSLHGSRFMALASWLSPAGRARPGSSAAGTPSGVKRRCPQTWVRAKRSTLRAGARAKEFSRLPGNSSTWLTLARSDRDPRMRWRPTTADRTGACFPSAKRDRPSGHQPPLRKRESPTARLPAPRVHLLTGRASRTTA